MAVKNKPGGVRKFSENFAGVIFKKLGFELKSWCEERMGFSLYLKSLYATSHESVMK